MPDRATAAAIDIVEPAGTSCGAVTTATAADSFFIGKDGTLIDLTGPAPLPAGPGNHCTATYYPQVLRSIASTSRADLESRFPGLLTAVVRSRTRRAG